MSAVEPIIALEDVTFAYREGREVLRDVSLDVADGEFVAVIGANGSGKSTLARIIGGLLKPQGGTVQAPPAREIGMVFQNPESQSVAALVEDDVAFGPENLGVAPSEIRQRVTDALEAVGMAGFELREVAELSGGQKQRVALAGALAMQPKVLVLDEPCAMLDARGREAVMGIMKRLHEQGTTIVLITHFMDDAAAADRVIALGAGRVCMQGTPAEVFADAETLHKLHLQPPFEALVAACMAAPDVAPEATPAAPACADASPIIAFEGVDFSYDGATAVLKDINLSIAQGSCLGIIGSTGSGKSTLIQLMNALLAPDSGSVVVDGMNTAQRAQRMAIRSTVGVAFQYAEHQLFASSVAEDVAFGPRNLGLAEPEVQARVAQALEQVGLNAEELGSRSPFDLSGGQQRLAALAGILAMQPKVLVLDEPMAGLDPQAAANMRQLIARLRKQGLTCVMVSHSMDDVAALCTQVVALNAGEICLQGTPAEVFALENVETLEQLGLGLPQPAQYARTHNIPSNPLTLEALLAALH